MVKTLQECIDTIIESLQEMKQIMSEDDKSPKETLQVQSIVKEEKKQTFNPENVPAPPIDSNPEGDFASLAKTLEDERWPTAVNPRLICDPNNEVEKTARGRGILDLMVGQEEFKNANFLDFGCGEGYSVKAAIGKAAYAVGYDVQPNNNWITGDNFLFTDQWDEVVKKGPYKSILCFDVIDHSMDESPLNILKKMKSVLADDGKIFLRVHPWTSRHANHFYHHINKAYIHLVFTEEELKKLHPEWGSLESKDYTFNVGFNRPLLTYKSMIEEAGLAIEYKRDMKEDVEPFFRTPIIAKRIQNKVGLNEFPAFQMQLQFVDYCLKK